MAFDFPSAPANGAEYTSGGVTYVWNGQGWALKAGAAADDWVNVTGDTMTGALIVRAAPPPNAPFPQTVFAESVSAINIGINQYLNAGNTSWHATTDGHAAGIGLNMTSGALSFNVTPAPVVAGQPCVSSSSCWLDKTGLFFGNGFAISLAQESNWTSDANNTIFRFSGLGDLNFVKANGGLYYTYNASAWCSWSPGGHISITGEGFKAVAGPWAAGSDSRIKTVTGDYTQGLDAIKQLAPRRFVFKGNDIVEATARPLEDGEQPSATGQPNQRSAHYEYALSGKECIGLVAQEAETAMPEMISKVAGEIDGATVDDLRIYDPNALTYALINAVKELSARIEALEGAAPTTAKRK